MQIIDKLGKAPLFLGVETAAWGIAQFQQAAQVAKALGFTALFVKVADGATPWYANIGGWRDVIAAVEGEGVNAIPYMYCYGDTYGGLRAEIALLSVALQKFGVVVADMESEYNGEVQWALTVRNTLMTEPGLFGVTTWADPQLQRWGDVLIALSPAVDFWLPQVYSDYLATQYKAQFEPLRTPYYPVLNLGGDFGPNNITQIANASQSPIVAFWEYQRAGGDYAGAIKAIIEAMPQGDSDMMSINDPFAAKHFEDRGGSPQRWHCKDTGCDIIGAMLDYWRRCGGAFRLPRTNEIFGVLPGQASFQVFEVGVLVYDPKLVVDNPGLGAVYAMHLDMDTVGLRKLNELAGITVSSESAAQIAAAMKTDLQTISTAAQHALSLS